MKRVCQPYYDPEFDSLPERLYGPPCRVNIDNESMGDCTVVKIDSVNKQGLLLEVVQVLTDMNLTITKGFISSDAGWFMDVFHVKNEQGKKVTDSRVIESIQQAGSRRTLSPKIKSQCKLDSHLFGPRAIEITGKDRPGLFSEISAALADLHCNVIEAHAWSHNARLACVAYISDQSTNIPMDERRLHAIEDHLTTILRATTSREENSNHHEVKTAGLLEGELATMTNVERRLHQLMLSVRDFDRPTGPSTTWRLDSKEKERKAIISIESCTEKGYSIVSIKCKDRKRLMFDTVCTLTDMQYVIFHASVDARGGYAYQEYFIRHADGCVLNTDSETERVIKCLQAAIERRVCAGVRLELCALNRAGLLSDITRVLRENGLAVVRADVATQGEKSVYAFYVRDISGNNVNLDFVKSMKTEMGAIDLVVIEDTTIARPTSPGKHRFSIGDMLRSQIERFSHNFVAIK